MNHAATINDPFADMQDDSMVVLSAPKIPEPVIYTEPCPKCRGKGTFTGYTGWALGPCFKCEGSGRLNFKTPPAARAASRASSQAAKARKENEHAEAIARKADQWSADHPLDAAWIAQRAGSFDFATSMGDALAKWGHLTDGQLAAVTRCREGDAQRAQERAQMAASAPAVDTTALEAAFGKAMASGLRTPRITLGGLTFKPAKPTGSNPGAIYVTERGEYLGKVMAGKFLRVRACPEEAASQVAEMIRDPKSAAEAYGLRSGNCCLCNRLLTNKESLERGIGPICAEKFGW